MDINEGTTTEDLWTPYKELVAVVEGYLVNDGGAAPYPVHTFESVLRRHKQTFLSLLKNPAKNAASREEIKRGITEGVNLPSIGRTLLSKELVDEAIIISDMYSVNEYMALELLHTAVRQMPRHPGLARGLVAVMLYYDGRRAIVQALKELITATKGVSWSIKARDELIKYVTRYAEQLMADGLLNSVLDALQKFSLSDELILLQNNRALPPRKHHCRLLANIELTRKQLAGVIFAASAQRGLERNVLFRILVEQSTSPTLTATGCLDDVSLALQMSLLYALDLSILHRREDGEELAKKLPLIQDPDLISVLLDELCPATQNGQGQEHDKPVPGVRALCQLSLGLALAALKRAPQCLLQRGQGRNDLLDQDEALIDAAIDNKAFEYLDEVILSSDTTLKEEYYQRRIHILITDFIVLMHSKLMEMRVKADEAARTAAVYASEGLAPPLGCAPVGSRLGALLRCVERLYARDPRRLRDDFWQPASPALALRQGRAASLHKFVRLSGSLAGAPLVRRYLRALASLAVARHTWALLAERDASLARHHLLSAIHRYHSNLRADPAPFSNSLQSSSMGATAIVTPAARPAKLLVRQEEVEALIAALKLIEGIAKVDESAAMSICENLQWDTINCMVGLVCCHVPLALKAALCSALGALGAGVGRAARVWAALDQAQLCVNSRPLNQELLEVECRIEDYPLSLAFVELLHSLCAAAPLPLALGAGSRAPGLGPYVQHVLCSVALPAPHRTYCRPIVKWQILAVSLKLFALWLDQYEPSPADFPPVGRAPETDPPPGFRIAIQLHTKSELLRLLFNLLEETQELLADQFGQGKEYIEECLINVLSILERGLALEKALQACATEARATLTPLSKLILVPESAGATEQLGSVCAVLQLGAYSGEAARRAVALLLRVTQVPAAARHLLHVLAQSQDLRYGFVECLELEERCFSGGDAEAVRRSKEGVVMLLLQTCNSAAPNLTHCLTGYRLTDDLSNSVLHEAGSSGNPRTCIHAILDILDAHISMHNSGDREASDLVEGCYRLVYMLCSRSNTAGPILGLLRSRDQFLTRHIKDVVNLERASAVTVSARSWVLRACAHAAAAPRPAAARSQLLQPLLHTHHDQDWEWCLLRRLFYSLPVQVEAVEEPRWELFHARQLREAIAQCDLPTGLGGKRISVSRVHALLARELATLQPSAPQRSLVHNEIQKVLDYVTEVNRQRNLAATLTHYYDSWRQLTEILFCVASQDILNIEAKKNLLLNILQDLLNKIPPTEVLPQIGNLASGTVLLLLVNLRHCYILQKRESSMKSKDFETSFFGPTNQIMQTNSLTLKFILHKILSWILVSGSCTQKMRVNLYGALLNYLNIVNLKISPAESSEREDMHYVSRLDSSKARPSREESSLKSMVVDVINGFGDSLCSLVCGDCVGAGQDVCRMVALSCLDTLIEINPRTDWMNTLTNQGYLRNLIDSLLQDDEGLMQALEANPKSLRVLYVYESKMALLVKIAQSRAGAETVLASGALAGLASVRALSRHPDVHAQSEGRDTDFMPSVAKRFRQILLPALALCSTLLSSLGTQNHSCVAHVTRFLLSHIDTLDTVLRAVHPNSPEGLLQEAEAVVGVVARAADCLASAEPEAFSANAELARIRSLMLALLNTFAVQPIRIKIVCWSLLYCASGNFAAPPAALRLLNILYANRDNCRLESSKDPEQFTIWQCAESLALRLCWGLARRAAQTPALMSSDGIARVGAEEACELRKHLVATFNDRFIEQVIESAKSQPVAQRGFTEVMLKDIKSMIQFS